ncbi:hypothetical protein [Limnohabitans sp. JirII-31]|uniref:DUF6941 family protein n=1 Tax=Limnohabitans sp. JirII-31 TaxID=1977908 RepID=UPI000C1F5BA5|nr:hypothetical protein [Limnohabitans sp. JirII-31]PIT74343.1 hypothetical protein B9Z41_13860 [Limnohabitans sp. JirII-31]
MNSLENFNLTCIYCDDIRDEVSGKTSIVGWYPVEPIQLKAEEPLLLPTLCVLGLLSTPLDLKFSEIKVELLQNENIVQNVTVPEQSLDQVTSDLGGSNLGRQMRVAFKIVNLQVSEPTLLRMRVTIDGQALESNPLSFVR